jgi:hypothetical protein
MKKFEIIIICFVLPVLFSCSKKGGFNGFGGYKNYGGKAYDSVRAIAGVAEGGYVMTGMSTSFGPGNIEAYLLRIDENGRMKWQKTFGGPGDNRAFSVAETADRGFAMCGYTDSYGRGNKDAYLIKTDKDGKIQWQATYGGVGNDEAMSLNVLADGGFILVGDTDSFSGKNETELYLVRADSTGKEVWSRTYKNGTGRLAFGTSVKTLPDGGFIISGRTSPPAGSGMNGYVLRVDADGKKLWSRTFGAKGYTSFQDLVVAQDGGYACVGQKDDASKGNKPAVYLAGLDVKGNTNFEKTFGGSSIDIGQAIVQDKHGNYIICGTTDSFGNGSTDILLIKADAQGNSVWMTTFGGRKDEYGAGVVLAPDEDYVAAGWTGTYGQGEYDAFAVKVDGKGNMR